MSIILYIIYHIFNYISTFFRFILAKLLRFQRTFHEKSFVSGFGADAPTDNAHKKHGIAVLFYIFIICWNCRSKPCFKGLFEKIPLKIRKNFRTERTALFWRAFILNSAPESYHLVDANARFCDNFIVQNDLFSALSANRIVHVHESCCLHIRAYEIF